jgi:hypothetical protein
VKHAALWLLYFVAWLVGIACTEIVDPHERDAHVDDADFGVEASTTRASDASAPSATTSASIPALRFGGGVTCPPYCGGHGAPEAQ